MQRTRTVARIVTGIIFILAGIAHFRRTQNYVAIMPPYLPQPEALVALSGYAEGGLGALVCFPQLRRPAGWGLIALLMAVFPANLHMALHTARYAQIPAWILWTRLPLQPLLIAWVYWCTHGQTRYDN